MLVNNKDKNLLIKFKDEGNDLFKDSRYAEAVKVYEDGLAQAKRYEDAWVELPYQNRFETSKDEALKEGQMYKQQLQRLKAQFHNNISTTYFKVNAL